MFVVIINVVIRSFSGTLAVLFKNLVEEFHFISNYSY